MKKKVVFLAALSVLLLNSHAFAEPIVLQNSDNNMASKIEERLDSSEPADNYREIHILDNNDSVSSALNSEDTTPVLLETPQNVRLTDDCVASWSNVEGADYYYVYLLYSTNPNTAGKHFASFGVYYSDTTANVEDGIFEYDLSEKIKSQYKYSVQIGIFNPDDSIYISLSVLAGANSNNPYYSSEKSDVSNTISYTADSNTRLAIPQNISFSDNGIASWSDVEGADYYYVYLLYSLDPDAAGNHFASFGVYYSDNAVTIENGVFEYDLSERIKSQYKYSVQTGRFNPEETIYISFTVQAGADTNSPYLSSEKSDVSNKIMYSSDSAVILMTPQNVRLSDYCVASWNDVTGADYYYVYLQYSTDPYSAGNHFASFGIYYSDQAAMIADGVFLYDLSEKIQETYRHAAQTGSYHPGDPIYISLLVQAGANINSSYASSEKSDASNSIMFTGRIPDQSCKHEHSICIPAVAQTCTNTGNTEYQICLDCMKCFDAEGNEIEKNSWLIPATHIHHYVSGVCVDCQQSFDLTGLTQLVLPEELTTIGDYAFSKALAEVIVLPENCKTISKNAFSECDLKYVLIPSEIESIAKDAFEVSKNVEIIIVQ